MTKPPFTSEDIAVVGMAGRFPGSPDIDAFWENLVNGVEAIERYDDETLRAAGVPEDTLSNSNYVKAGCVLEGFDKFDPGFFGFTPKEAAAIDPQQRVFLETAWHALEDAGHDPESFRGDIGLFAGKGQTLYLYRIAAHPELIRDLGVERLAMLNEKDFLATWAAYKLNLTGPAYTVQTACSTSLAAIHLACQSLIQGECRMALAGGTRIHAFDKHGYWRQEGGILSPDGHCRPFDAQARGTVGGSGAGVVALRLATDAWRDGDRIYALVKGSAVNNDGSNKVGYTAPSVRGQAEVIRRACRIADIAPEALSYVEAHGTATLMGDPIEVEALTQAFDADRRGFCALGSVKANLGHLDAAAGVAGFIKTALALHHRQLPASLHYRSPNPEIDFANSPFYVNAESRPWRGDNPLRAGVSSFGIGGTNVHAVLQEAPAQPTSAASRPLELLTVSAHTEPALERHCKNLAAWLRAHPEASFSDVAGTLRQGRKAMTHRRAVVASGCLEAAAALEEAITRPPAKAAGAKTNLAMMFPGQGSQHAGMAAGLYRHFSDYREAFDRCAEILKDHDVNLRELVLPGKIDKAAQRRLAQTEAAQPALFAVGYALARLWLRLGLRPRALIGHSVGEYAAACLAGVFSLEDALALVAARGRLMQRAQPGAMLAVPLPEAELAALLPPEASIAAVNAPNRCVAAGPTAVIDALTDRLAERGVAARRLQVSHAFHSAMMEPVLNDFRAAFQGVALHPPKVNTVSCVTGTWLTAEQATNPDYWTAQARQPVRFADGVAKLLSQPSISLLEVGPRLTLTALAAAQGAKSCRGSLPAGDGDDLGFFLNTAGALWLDGAPLRWDRFEKGRRLQRLSLPLYPFERARCWIAPTRQAERATEQDTPTQPTAGEAASHAVELETRADRGQDTAPVAVDRKSTIRRQLTRTLQQTFGFREEDLDPTATFFELGVDSMLLIQASVAIQRDFGVDVSFHDAFSRFPTLDALVDHLTSVLPADAALYREPQSPAVQMANRAPTPAPDRIEGRDEAAVTPFQAPDRSALALTPRQTEALADFTRRFNAKTAVSKRLNQEQRKAHADPRAASGFKPIWKELVYRVISDRSEGSRVWDVDGNEYIDLTNCFGANIFGHNPPLITEAIARQIQRGMEVGPQSGLAGEAAALVCKLTGMERALFSNTGTEAVMAAVRIARTVTGRAKIVLFSGSYHGTFDGVLARSLHTRDGAQTMPTSPGTTHGMVADVIVLPYAEDSLAAIEAVADELAAILVEPVQSRRPHFFPVDFLKALRGVADRSGACLIFDEVVVGFRAHPGGAQALAGVRADLAVYGKVLGGGMPIGVVAGSARYMDAIDGGFWSFGDDSAPTARQTLFAGTFCKHPLTLAATLAALKHFEAEGPALQERLNRSAAELTTRLDAAFHEIGAPIDTVRFSSLFRLRFLQSSPFTPLMERMLLYHGLHVWEGGNLFLTTAHSQADLAAIETRMRRAAQDMLAAGFLDPVEKQTAREPESAPLTDGQRQIWVACQMGESANAAYNETTVIPLETPVDEPALARALNKLAERHDALRVRIAADGERQWVEPSSKLALRQVEGLGLAEARTEQAATTFNLAQAPLCRAVLARDATRAELILTAHHIIVDAWSIGALIRDLRALYRAEQRGAPANLPETEGFAAYARRVAASETDDTARGAEDYWVEKLAGARALELPPDRARPASPSFAGRKRRILLDAALTGRCRAFGARREATLFHTMLAAFQILLGRLSGERDVVLACPAAGQLLAGQPNLVGYCLNLLPVRGFPRDDRTFDELAAETKAAWLAGFERKAFSFKKVLDRLEIPADPSRHPLFAATFNLEPNQVDADRLPVGDLGPALVKFDLIVDAMPAGDGIAIDAAFNSDLFDSETVAGWLSSYAALLDCLTAAPDRPLGAASLLSETARQSQLTAACADVANYPERAVHELVRQRAAASPHAVAIVEAGRALSYGELERRADLLAGALRTRGLGPGRFAAVLAERSIESVTAMLAALETGGAYLPIDTAYPPARIEDMVEDAAPSVFITRTAHRHALPSLQTPMVDLDEFDWDAAPSPPVASPPTPADCPANLIYTSGSTGRPKGVIAPHRAVVRLVVNTSYIHIRAEETVAHASNIAFDAATFEIWGALIHGARLAVIDQDTAISPEDLAAQLRSDGVDHFFLTTALFNQTTRQRPDAFASLKTLLFGGEAVDPTLVAMVLRHGPPQRLLHVYGPTESATYASWHPVAAVAERAATVPIGRPLTNTTLFALDDRFNPVAPGEPGQLFIGGDGLALGYLNRPALTAEKFIANPHATTPGERLYATGDLVRLDHAGDIRFLGRRDTQIKLRGFRIELGEIQHALRHCADVADAYATMAEQPVKRIVAYVVAAPAAELSVASLRAELSQRLPDYMIPAAFVVLPALPITPNGKIDRRALPEPDWSTRGDAAKRRPPQTETERTLAGIWRELLRLDRIGVDDNLFELGGDSIIAIQIAGRARAAGLPVKPRQLLQRPTIAALAAELDATQAAPTVEQDPVTGPVALTPIQRWFFESEPAAPHWFNQSVLLETRSRLDPELIRQTAALLQRRHEALRLRLTRAAGGWRQWLAEPNLPAPLITIDLSEISEPERAVTRQAAALQRGLDLAKGPIWRIAHFDLGADKPGRLLLIVNHLAVDGVSWRLLLADFQTVHEALARNAKPRLAPIETSLKTWSSRLAEHAQTEACHAAAQRFLDMPWNRVQPPPRDIETAGQANDYGSMHAVNAYLEEGLTQALLTKLPRELGARIHEALLAAVALALDEWTGGAAIAIDLESHGRDTPLDGVDLSAAVGWFTAVYPVVIDLAGAREPAAALTRVQSALDRVDAHGADFGAARYLARDETLRQRLAALPPARISFNYLGRFDQTLRGDSGFTAARESAGPNQSPANRRGHWIDLNASILGDRLTMSWTYSVNRHREETIVRLAERAKAWLAAILAAESARPLIAGDLSRFRDFGWDRAAALEIARAVPRHDSDAQLADVYPLSPLQEGMLFHSLLAPDAGVYVVQTACRIRGDLDIQAFDRAFAALMDRHPILRTALAWEGLARPVQAVCQDAPTPLSVIAFDDAPEDTRIEAWRAIMARDRQIGFALDHAPLTRLLLGRLADDDHLLAWSFHHALLDGWSMPLVFRDLFALYRAACSGGEAALPPAPAYRDYIAWLERLDQEAPEQYWRERLRGFREPTPLTLWPPDRPPANEAEAFGVIAQALTPMLSQALRGAAKRRGLTANTLFQGAWALALSRWSGQRDVLFGATVSGRPAELPQAESMVGLFINTLPVRTRPTGHSLFEWLRALQEAQFADRQHEHMPLTRIQEWSEVPRGAALFETIFAYENYPMTAPADATDRPDSDGPALRLESPESIERPHYPLALMVDPGERFQLNLFFDGRRFAKRAVQLYLDSFLRALETIAADEDRSLDALTLVDAAAKADLLARFSRGPLPKRASPALFLQRFEARAAESPNLAALVFEGASLTYGELNRFANQVAAELLAMDGGRPEDRVGVFLERSPELIVALLGIWKAGRVYTPLDPAYPPQRLAFMLAESQARVALTMTDLKNRLPPTDAEIRCLDEAQSGQSDPGNPKTTPARDQLAYLIFTSGSTGQPKGVMITHGGLANLAAAQDRCYPTAAETRVLQFSSPNFDASIYEIVMALRAGGELHLAPRESLLPGPALADLLRARAITHLTIPPSALTLVPDAAAPGLRALTVAGETCPADLATQWADDRVFYNAYGPTETTVWATIDRCDGAGKPLIGRPVDGVTVHLLRDGRLTPIGAPGEIHIGGAGLGRGYQGKPNLTAAAFTPDPFGAGDRLYKTGDAARWRPDGRLEFLGRVDHQVKLRGFRIEPGEIEAALKQSPNVREAVAVVRASRGEPALAAYLVFEDAERPAADVWRERLRRLLPEHMIPASFTALEALPLTPNGKLDRAALPEPDVERPELAIAFAEPKNEAERKTLQAWRKVLGRDKIGVDDPFFDLGGHSLRMIQLQAELKRRFGAAPPLAALFEAPTVRGMAAYMQQGQTELNADKIQDRAARQRAARRQRRQPARPGRKP